MRIGVCTGPEKVPQPVAGLDYIEGTVGDLLCPRDDDASFAARVAAVGAAAVAVEALNCFIPGDVKTTGPAVDAAAVDNYVTAALKRAERMGISIIVFGSGGSRSVPEGWDRRQAAEQLVGHMRRWGPPGGQAGVTIVLEPLNSAECNFVNSLDEAADLVRRADHPNIRLLFDTYHMARDNDPPDAIRRAAGLIAHGHCAEGAGRGPLGTAGEDHRPYFRALKDIGYGGRVSIEANWKDLPRQLPDAVAELRRQIESA